MAFKGIFDGSVEIGQAREARAHESALQRQRIAAQMAMQTQQLRAQAQAQRAQLQASMQQANADRALKQQALQADTAMAGEKLNIAKQELGLKQQEIGIKQQEFDAGKSLRDMQQENAKLMLQQALSEFDEDQARRAALTKFRQSAFGAGLITAALNGVAPTATLSRINQANGVADFDPGSIVGMGGGPEGLWYDVIAVDEQGEVGKRRQEVDPMTLLAVAHSLYGEKGVGEFIQMYKTRDTNNTRMNIAMDKYMQAYELQQLKNQVAKEIAAIKSDTTLAVEDKRTERAMKLQELKNQVGGVLGISPAKVDLATSVTKLGAILDTYDADMRYAKKKGLPPDPEKVALRAKTKALLDKVLAIGEEPGATAGAAPAGQSPKVEAKLDKGELVVTINGQTARMPDTPKNRATLQQKYGISTF